MNSESGAGRKWNKLCNILIKGKKMCMLLGCDGCCMLRRSRPDERGKHMLMMDGDEGWNIDDDDG